MKRHSVILGNRAKKEIKKLPKKEARKIVNALDGLVLDPRPKGVEKLQENPNFWRLRCGKYRLIYAIDTPKLEIYILVIRKRGDAYRRLGNLDQLLAAIDFS